MIWQAILAFSSSAMPVKLPVERHFNRYDYALYAGVVAGRAGDWITTEHIGDHGGHENILPSTLTHSKGGFMAFSAGMAVGEIGLSVYMHRHGHAKLARLMDSVSFGSSAVTDLYNLHQIHRQQGIEAKR